MTYRRRRRGLQAYSFNIFGGNNLPTHCLSIKYCDRQGLDLYPIWVVFCLAHRSEQFPIIMNINNLEWRTKQKCPPSPFGVDRIIDTLDDRFCRVPSDALVIVAWPIGIVALDRSARLCDFWAANCSLMEPEDNVYYCVGVGSQVAILQVYISRLR